MSPPQPPVPHSLLAAVSHAGTSSFGMSGVNAHAIITPPPPAQPLVPSPGSAQGASAAARGHVWVCQDMRRLAQLPVGHPLLAHVARSPASLRGSPSAAGAATTVEFVVQLGGGGATAHGAPGGGGSAAARLAWLWDHHVQGRPLLPGAAYMEAAAAAAARLGLPGPASGASQAKAGGGQGSGRLGALAAGGGGGVGGQGLVALERGAFVAPCVLPEAGGGGAALLLLVQLDAVAGRVRVSSVGGQAKGAAAAAPPTTHFTASMTAVAAGPAASPAASSAAAGRGASSRAGMPRSSRLGADAARARASHPLDAAALYTSLRGAGLQYGRAFRMIRDPRSSSSSSAGHAPTDPRSGSGGSSGGSSSSAPAQELAQARLPLTSCHAGQGYHLHPALLDCTLQLGAALGGSGGPPAQGGAQVGCVCGGGVAACMCACVRARACACTCAWGWVRWRA